MKSSLYSVFFLCFFMGCLAPFMSWAATTSTWDFSFFEKGPKPEEGPIMLVIGGIQGDEPGGFSAATLIATRYKVQKGTIWVVPNLNFPSIIKRSRGVHGDMNRKFAALDSKDPQYNIVSRIQEIIRHPRVSLVLNLHDGSGYYRPTYIDKWYNPKRWGQSIIIDQAHMPSMQMAEVFLEAYPEVQSLENLAQVASTVSAAVNKHLLTPDHKMYVHDTETAKGDKEMEKSLSWFAVRHGKPAFGLEASKNLSVVRRTYYHLHMIENFAHALGIEFERDFALSLDGVHKALYSDLSVSFMNGRVVLPLEDVRSTVNYLPLCSKDKETLTSKPIMAVIPQKKTLDVHYGNRKLTVIRPDWHELDTSIAGHTVSIDGKERFVTFGELVHVHKDFTVLGQEGFRINAIGANTGKKNESDTLLNKAQFMQRYSIDNGGSIYRVESYKGKKFCGMFLVRFVK